MKKFEDVEILLNEKPVPANFHDMTVVDFKFLGNKIVIRIWLVNDLENFGLLADDDHLAILEVTYYDVSVNQLFFEDLASFKNIDILHMDEENGIIHIRTIQTDIVLSCSFSYKSYKWKVVDVIHEDQVNCLYDSVSADDDAEIALIHYDEPEWARIPFIYENQDSTINDNLNQDGIMIPINRQEMKVVNMSFMHDKIAIRVSLNKINDCFSIVSDENSVAIVEYLFEGINISKIFFKDIICFRNLEIVDFSEKNGSVIIYMRNIDKKDIVGMEFTFTKCGQKIIDIIDASDYSKFADDIDKIYLPVTSRKERSLPEWLVIKE